MTTVPLTPAGGSENPKLRKSSSLQSVSSVASQQSSFLSRPPSSLGESPEKSLFDSKDIFGSLETMIPGLNFQDLITNPVTASTAGPHIQTLPSEDEFIKVRRQNKEKEQQQMAELRKADIEEWIRTGQPVQTPRNLYAVTQEMNARIERTDKEAEEEVRANLRETKTQQARVVHDDESKLSTIETKEAIKNQKRAGYTFTEITEGPLKSVLLKTHPFHK